MCGLFGVVFQNPPKRAHRLRSIRLFNSLAVCSVTRGGDATGVAVVQRSGDTPLYKNTVAAPIIVDTKRWKRLLDKVDDDTAMLMGHTRFGTHGENTPGNAHPFAFTHPTYGDLVGTHNGMIYNHDELLATEAKYESDSANLFFALASLPENEFTKILSRAWGSYALVFRQEDHVYFVRNSGSPLYICRAPELGVMLYASEPGILRNAAKAHSVKLTRPAEINANRLYAINLHTYKERVIDFTPDEEALSVEQMLLPMQKKRKAMKWSVT